MDAISLTRSSQAIERQFAAGSGSLVRQDPHLLGKLDGALPVSCHQVLLVPDLRVQRLDERPLATRGDPGGRWSVRICGGRRDGRARCGRGGVLGGRGVVENTIQRRVHIGEPCQRRRSFLRERVVSGHGRAGHIGRCAAPQRVGGSYQPIREDPGIGGRRTEQRVRPRQRFACTAHEIVDWHRSSINDAEPVASTFSAVG